MENVCTIGLFIFITPVKNYEHFFFCSAGKLFVHFTKRIQSIYIVRRLINVILTVFTTEINLKGCSKKNISYVSELFNLCVLYYCSEIPD